VLNLFDTLAQEIAVVSEGGTAPWEGAKHQ
jgi:hypothetical protein